MRTEAKLLVRCLAAMVLAASVCPAFAQFSGGSGSVSDPYLIATAGDLNAIRGSYLGALGSPKYYKQTADIDLSGYANWDPIGSIATAAYLNYDGNNYHITNLNISRSGTSGVGLFGKLVGDVYNLALDSGSVVGNYYVGSFVGFLDSGVIKGCRSSLAVSGTSSVGGLVGYGSNSEIRWSLHRANTVAASGSIAGGLIGISSGTDLINSYAASPVSAGSLAGGLTGSGSPSASGCYWDTTVSGQSTSSGGGTGKTTSQMQQRATFSGWDFDSRWQLYEDNSYPYLQALAEDTATPVLSPSSGSFVGASLTVTATCATAGASIHYSTNGLSAKDTDPSVSSGGTFSVPIPSSVHAVAWVPYRNPSTEVTATYAAAPSVETPTLSPGAGSYPGSSLSVTVSVATAGATLRYTLDGSDPTGSTPDTVADGGTVEVTLTDPPETLKVRAFKDDLNQSDVVSATYTTADNAGAPVANPAGGTFVGSSLSVTMTCNTAGADIWYTTNGSEPAVSNGTKIVSGGVATVPLASPTNVIKSIASATGLNPSVITTSVYYRAASASAPGFDPLAGAFASSHVKVTIASASVGALIRYTVDGSEPDESTPTTVTNGGSVTVSIPEAGTTLKARAYRDDLNPSAVSSAFYEPAEQVATPLFTPVGGQPTGTVQITCSTTNATIRYTTDGTQPATDSTIATNGEVVVVSVPGTLKARAWKDNMYTSAIQTGYYGDFAGGSGTPFDPYLIATATHLDNVRDHLTNAFEMVASVDLGVSPWNSGSGWQPIGAFGNAFNGMFDGGGYVVSNLTINRLTTDDIGLFGYIESEGNVKCLGIKGGSVSGRNYVGGLVGYCEGDIAQCYTTCDIDGSILELDGGAGGLVGVGTSAASLTDCYATGTVSGSQNLGGLIGYSQSTITRCYAAGAVSDVTSYDGGLIGRYVAGSVSVSYWDTQTSGQGTSGGGTGKTTAEMKEQATFVGWDFADVWEIEEGVGYPILQCFGDHPVSIPADWMIQYYGSVDDAPYYSVKGYPLSWEYVAGTNPTNENSLLFIASSFLTGDSLNLSVMSISNRVYGVQSRTSLMSGAWARTSGVSKKDGTGSALNFSIPGGASNGYYRVTVELSE